MDNRTDDTILEALIKLINETLSTNQKQDSTLNIVSTLWIVLFLLIIIQKVFKYVVKPCYNQRNQNLTTQTQDENTITHDPSVHCLVV